MRDERLPDPIERGEAYAEQWADEAITGDMYRCYCNRTVPLAEVVPVSANPYARPACRECAEEILDPEDPEE